MTQDMREAKLRQLVPGASVYLAASGVASLCNIGSLNAWDSRKPVPIVASSGASLVVQMLDGYRLGVRWPEDIYEVVPRDTLLDTAAGSSLVLDLAYPYKSWHTVFTG